MICTECDKEMTNLGNIAGINFTVSPSKWDQVWVCDDCKVKKSVEMTGPNLPNYSNLDEYREI